MADGSSVTAGSRRRRKGIGLSLRISLPLLLPVLGLLALAGLLLTQKLEMVSAMQRVGRLTEVIADTSALVHELQRERGASSGFLASKGTELEEELTVQHSRTDTRVSGFEARLRHFDTARFAATPELATRLGAARDALVKLGDIRQQIRRLAIPGSDSFAYYTGVNKALLDLVGALAAAVEAPDVARSVSVYLNFLQAKELAGQERATGAAGFAAGRFDAARLRTLVLLSDQQDLYFRIIAAAATPAQSDFIRQTMAAKATETVARMRRTAVAGGLDGHLDGISSVDWFKAATVRIELLKQIEDRLASDLMAQAETIQGQTQTSLYVAMAMIIGLLALTAGISVVMIRAIVGPLGGLIRIMHRLAAGDVEVAITSTARGDEIGRMAAALQVFRDQALDNRRLAVAQDQQRVRAEADKHAALCAMADAIETETSRASIQVNGHTSAMATSADSMNASASRTGAAAHSAAVAAEQALSNAQTVASAAEQLTASIQEISAQMGHSTNVVGRAVSAGDETRATMQQLDNKVAQIGTVAEMIRSIAAKTNLLALNATIEAARAGAAGKGFAVVASEVKDLAMQTARSTEEISRHLAEVRSATAASVNAVGRIGETIVEVDSIASSIAAAVEQQGAATAEIARNMTQTAQAADEMTRRIGEVTSEAEANRIEAGHVRDGAASMAASVTALKHTVIRVVRTFSSDLERRQAQRYATSLRGRLTLSGGVSHGCGIADLSETGARLSDLPVLPTGRQGILELDGIAVPLACSVRNQYDNALGVMFDGGDAVVEAIRRVLQQLSVRQAA